MPRYTIPWLTFQEIADRAAQELKDIGGQEFNPGVLQAYASDASRQFAIISESVKDTRMDVLRQGVYEYQLPQEIYRINRVLVLIPGESKHRVLGYIEDRDVSNIAYQESESTPCHWYLTPDNKTLGIYPVPNDGGAKGITTSNGTTTTLISTSLGTTDDLYVGMRVKFYTEDYPAYNAVEPTVTDYDAATNTLTFSPAIGDVTSAGWVFEIHPDSIVVEYTSHGNAYHETPRDVVLEEAMTTLTRMVITENLSAPQGLPEDYYKGMEIRYKEHTPDALRNYRARIISSESSEPQNVSIFTVHPPAPYLLASATALIITDCPNSPDGWHGALVDFVVARALKRRGDARYLQYEADFNREPNQAKASQYPRQRETYHQVREARISKTYGRRRW